MSGEMKAFYMTVTPTVKTKTEKEYEQVMSDFETQLRKPITLDSRMKWQVTMMNIFIPLDTRLVSKSNYNRHWFQYIWCQSSSHFKQKYYFLNSSEREDVTEFCGEFNRNRIIDHEMSLCKTKVPIECGITNSENLYMGFLEDVQKDSIVGVRMNKDILYNVYGGNKAMTFFQDGKVIQITHSFVVEDDTTVKLVVTPTRKIKKGVVGYSQHKVIRRPLDDTMGMVDVECNIIESNTISGVNGQPLRCVVDNVSDGFTEVDESKQDIYLPVELHEFSYIRCRLLDHETKISLQYKYDFVVGLPYIIVRISRFSRFCSFTSIFYETRDIFVIGCTIHYRSAS